MEEQSSGSTCKIDFATKKCQPCEGGTPPLTAEAATKYLASIAGWELFEGTKIKKEFKFKNFIGAMDFVNRLAKTAEAEGHHPTILISYNKVKITLTTHAIGGLSENDFIMAAKIDKLIGT
jgi:pterin-4a-carbinolamine dehydratase